MPRAVRASGPRARRSALALLLLSTTACNAPERRSDVPPGVTPSPPSEDPPPPVTPDAGSSGSPAVEDPTPDPTIWPALPPSPSPSKTPDGIPILTVTTAPSSPTPALREVSPVWNTLAFAQIQASDGLTTFVAVRNDAQHYSDVVLRGGELRTNVLQALAGTTPHPGGCGAAHDGTLLLSAPAPVPGETQTIVTVKNGERTTSSTTKLAQSVWIVDPAGTLTTQRLPPEAGRDAECKAVIERPDRFAIFASNLAEYDGHDFTIDHGWYRGRTLMSRPFGPRYCFAHCNAQEQAGTDATVAAAIEGALGQCQAEYAIHGDTIAARCRGRGSDIAVRHHVGGDTEVLRGLPTSDWLADGIFLTRDGDVVIELALEMKRYLVWPAGSPTASPERTLADDEILAQTSPTVLIRDLPEPVPPAEVYAVLLGQPLPFGANGSTYDYRSLSAGPTAHEARSKRAAAVLPKGPFVLAHDAAVQLSCGAYVRSPLGHEGDMIHDWVPPVLPALSPKAVHVPSTCVPLQEVHALPGDPDLLLARTPDGQLAVAWLPAPLPLPSGYDPREGKPATTPPRQDPRPGPGWTVVGPITSIDADRGLPSPGASTTIRDHTWQAGGGAVLHVDDRTLVLTRFGAWTLPDGTTPMAVQTGPTPKLYGALGPKLVVCEERCRTLDTGDSRPIIGVVPRTQSELILGFSREQTAVFRVPPTGGTETPPHALEAPLEAQLATKPKP